MSGQVRRASLAQQAADLLLERLRAGEWAIGEKLPGETALAPQLGVGRSTVREAIRQLAGRGVLTSRQGAGVFVAATDVPDNWDDVLRRADIGAVLEARLAVETEAAALAAERRSPAQLRAIRAALEHRSQCEDLLDEFVASDIAFHRAVVAAAQNSVLLDLFDSMTPRVQSAMVDMVRLQRTRPSAEVASAEADRDAHAEIVEAVAQRRPDLAAQHSRSHLDGLKKGLS